MSVAVAVLGRDGPAALHTLTTRHSQEPTDRVSVTGYEIRLAALTPLRDLPEQRIAPGDYVAEFVVSKASG